MANRTPANQICFSNYWNDFGRYVAMFEPQFSIEFSKALKKLPKEQTYYLSVDGYGSSCCVVVDLALKQKGKYHIGVGIDLKGKSLPALSGLQQSEIMNLFGLRLNCSGHAVRRLYVQKRVLNPSDPIEQVGMFHWICKTALVMRLIIKKYV